jgi:hypothetical protein
VGRQFQIGSLADDSDRALGDGRSNIVMPIVLRSNDGDEERAGPHFSRVISDVRGAHGAIAPDSSMGKIR